MANITSDLRAREQEVSEYIERYAQAFVVDPDLVRGLITQESSFVDEAQSPTGAYGYGQFTGIGARQVQNIAQMYPAAANLSNFEKREASDPDRGIQAICATLWWLFNVKYRTVSDKKVQLEAVLTFYNSGGRPAALVVKYEGHRNAVPYIKNLPGNIQSQSLNYAPHVIVWFVAWHEYMVQRASETPPVLVEPRHTANPFDEDDVLGMDVKYRALIEALLLLDKVDPNVDSTVSTRDELTEVTLVFPGEYK